MDRHIFLGVLLFSILAVVVGVFLLPGKPPGEVHLPWQITITAEGGSRVFGVEIGLSNLADAEHAFKEPAEVSLFENQDGSRVVEAYFDSVDISGLRARIVLVMQLDKAQLEEMFNRGERLANMGGGRRKVTLSQADLAQLQQMPFSSLSYIPRHNLDGELIRQRFGEPAEKLLEPKGKVEHWLYPDKGLDVALDPEGKEVLQYVRPEAFDLLRQPLRDAAKGKNNEG